MLLFLCWYSHSRLPKLLHLPVCTTSVWSLDLTLAPVNRHQKMINTVTANGNLSSSTNVNFVRKTLSLNEQCQLCKNNMEFERKNELCTNNEFEWTTTSLCKHQVWMNNVYFARPMFTLVRTAQKYFLHLRNKNKTLEVCRFGLQCSMITCTFQAQDLRQKTIFLGPVKCSY